MEPGQTLTFRCYLIAKGEGRAVLENVVFELSDSRTEIPCVMPVFWVKGLGDKEQFQAVKEREQRRGSFAE